VDGHHRRHQFAVAVVLLGLAVLTVALVAGRLDAGESEETATSATDVLDEAAQDAGASDLESLLALEEGLVPSGMEFETELVDGDVAAAAEKVLEAERDAGRSVVTAGYLDLYGDVWCALSSAAGEAYVCVVRADEGSGGCVVQTMRIDAESLA
jgi:hypothetical protein